MSRTIRRTHGNIYPISVHRWLDSDGVGFWEVIQKGHPEFKKESWSYHSDKTSNQYGIPRYIRRQRNKLAKTAEQRALIRAIQLNELDVVLKPRKKDAARYYY